MESLDAPCLVWTWRGIRNNLFLCFSPFQVQWHCSSRSPSTCCVKVSKVLLSVRAEIKMKKLHTVLDYGVRRSGRKRKKKGEDSGWFGKLIVDLSRRKIKDKHCMLWMSVWLCSSFLVPNLNALLTSNPGGWLLFSSLFVSDAETRKKCCNGRVRTCPDPPAGVWSYPHISAFDLWGTHMRNVEEYHEIPHHFKS